MNTKKILSAFLGIGLIGSSLTSCVKSDDPDTVFRQAFSGMVTAVFTNGNPDPSYTKDVSYLIDYNYTKMKTNVNIGGLNLGGTSFTILTLSNQPWTLKEDGWRDISVSNVSPTSTGATVLFDSFTFNVLDRTNIDSEIGYYPLTKINYDVQAGMYRVVSLFDALVNTGKTTVTSKMGEPFVTEGESTYIISLVANEKDDLNFADKRLASIRIKNAKFAAQMPGLNMSFDNIPYTIDNNGNVHLSSDALIPNIISFGTDGIEVINSTPNDSYPITNLNCVSDGMNNMTLTFTCTIKGMPFEVAVDCKTPVKL